MRDDSVIEGVVISNSLHSQKPSKISKIIDKAYKNLGEVFSDPEVASLCQSVPFLSALATYFGGKYSQEQFNTLRGFTILLATKLKEVDEEKIDMEFFDTEQGKRIIGKIFKGILRDNRIEKIEASANLTVVLFQKTKLNFDEREIYVDILDNLNALQLSILKSAMDMVKKRASDSSKTPHKGFGWEKLSKHYESKGITGAILLQSIRVLESNGLVNQNTAVAQDEEQTHFVTFFGEQFYSVIYSSDFKVNILDGNEQV